MKVPCCIDWADRHERTSQVRPSRQRFAVPNKPRASTIKWHVGPGVDGPAHISPRFMLRVGFIVAIAV
eukprot:scaffold47123_cov39-Attheya_sp.AAC.1